jgi:hypothetical protein
MIDQQSRQIRIVSKSVAGNDQLPAGKVAAEEPVAGKKRKHHTSKAPKNNFRVFLGRHLYGLDLRFDGLNVEQSNVKKYYYRRMSS